MAARGMEAASRSNGVGVYAESQSACECYEACFLPVAVGASEQPLYAVGLGVESLEGEAVEPSVEVYVFD